MIAIDIGNSRIKWALFEDASPIQSGVFAYLHDDIEASLESAQVPISGAPVMVCCVAGEEVERQLTNWLKARGSGEVNVLRSVAKQLDLKNAYECPEKLGNDRWAALLGAYYHPARKLHESICVVDCGTAVTLDVVDAGGQHQGGVIMPGYQLMLNSLAENTINLDVVAEDDIQIDSLAKNTECAMQTGVLSMLVQAIESRLRLECSNHTQGLCVFITGGDAEKIKQYLSYALFHEPKLVLIGLETVWRKSN